MQHPSMLRDVAAGFVAAALAVLIFHQGMLFLIAQAGWTKGAAWSLTAMPPYGVPRLVNAMFWGGLWGCLFGAIADRLPGRSYLIKGFVFGLVFTTILGSWLLVSLIKGRPLFGGFLQGYDLTKLRNGFLLNSVAFGIGLGFLFALMRRGKP
ncbi:MAG TPA: hypothetical protein VMX97_05495 [Hyphomicrobiaceae bacterium]|nr:hypothetical protein [Hyphomicrobiaceae bacterium]